MFVDVKILNTLPESVALFGQNVTNQVTPQKRSMPSSSVSTIRRLSEFFSQQNDLRMTDVSKTNIEHVFLGHVSLNMLLCCEVPWGGKHTHVCVSRHYFRPESGGISCTCEP